MTTLKVTTSGSVGKGYDVFWNCESRYRVLKGGKASKKSTTTAINFIYRLMRFKDSNLLVVRQVMNTHRDSTFAQLIKAQETLKVTHLWHNTVSPMEMTYIPTGQKILFRGFDDVLKLASTTVSKGYLCWVWIEEAYEIPKEEDFDKLDLSVPRGNVPNPLFKQTTLTFNPWSRDHWLKKRFFDKKHDNVSTFSTNYFINEFLDETDRAVFERMKNTSPRKYAVAGLGEWGISEGLVFENFVVGKPSSEEMSEEAKAYFGLDYGYTTDPTAFIAVKVDAKKRTLYIFDEFYERRMLNCDIANRIKDKGYAKERIRADSAEPKSNEDLKRMGITRIVPSLKGRDSILNGISKINEFKIFIDEKCKNTIREMSSYVYDTRRGENGYFYPKDSENHLMDALRYAFEDVKREREEPSFSNRPGRSLGVTRNDLFGRWEA